MTNKVFMLLDRSGSMQTMWKEAIDGINGFVGKLPADSEILIAAFDTGGYDVVRDGKVEGFDPVGYDEVSPRGGTPLLDSAGRMIWTMRDSKATRQMLVIITDGEENSSSKFSVTEIKNMVKELTTSENSDIVFLGANFDKIGDVAQNTFGMHDNTRMMKTSALGFASGLAATGMNTSAYFNSGVKAKSFYNADQQAKAEAK